MRPFNALSLAIGLILACLGITAVRADLQIDETLEKSGPWTIGYNSSLKGCVASAASNDRTTIWIGFDGREPNIPAYLAFTNPNWGSIEPRKFYELHIQALESHRWKGYGSGVERPNQRGLFVFGVKWRLLREFAQASGLVLSLNKEVLTRTNISDSSDALTKLISCQQHQIMALKSQSIEAIRLAEEKQELERDRLIAGRERISWEEAEKSRREQGVRERLETEEKEWAEQAKLERAERERREQIERENAEHPTKERGAGEQADAERFKRQESEAAARETREKASREQAERERVAREQRDAKEQEKEPDKPAQLPASGLSDNKVATLPIEQPPADSKFKGDAVERAIKQELKRVGCYDGRIDEDWQTEPVRAAVRKFAKLARLPVPPVEPTIELLDAIRARSERICPLECGRRQFEKDGRCIAKKCLAGFELDDDGDCVLRRRPVARHEANEDGDRPKVRSYETKRRARADSEQDLHYKKRNVTSTGHVACGPNGCKKLPIGCRAIRQPDGGNGMGGKIRCP
jgi:hypothetical protein